MSYTFLDKSESTKYFSDMCEKPEMFQSFRDLNIVRIYEGKRFVAFSKNKDGGYDIHGMLVVDSMNFDEDGFYVTTKVFTRDEVWSDDIGYIPTEVEIGPGSVFLSVPSQMTLERSLRVGDIGEVLEGNSAAFLIKHKVSPVMDRIGELQVVGELVFLSDMTRKVPDMKNVIREFEKDFMKVDR